MTKETKDFYVNHYGKLKGKTVSDVILDEADRDVFMGLLFTDGTQAWILCDPEGNGSGFLDIIEKGK